MRRALFPSGMVAVTEDMGPRFREGAPTAPIGTLWPEWWPIPRPPAPPAHPPVQPFEEEEEDECCAALDATLRPRDKEETRGSKTGRRISVDEVPPYPLTGLDAWARRVPVLG